MSARAATVYRSAAWALIMALVAASAPLAGYLIGGTACAFGLWWAWHGRSSVVAVPALWAGTAAMIVATVFLSRA